MWHDILHVLGVDTQQSYWYDFWSGLATQASLLFVGVGVYRRNNCRKRWCLRLGHYDLVDDSGVVHRLCSKHHPDVHHQRRHTHLDELIERRQADNGLLDLGS